MAFCLIFLAILTIMGTSGMEASILEEKMSRNMRDHSLAFRSAESALKNAEAWLTLQESLPVASSDGSTPVWSIGSMSPSTGSSRNWWDHAVFDSEWWATHGNAIKGVAGVIEQPAYIIEQYRTVGAGQSIAIGDGETVRRVVLHRITARGVGVKATTVVRLQSIFAGSYY